MSDSFESRMAGLRRDLQAALMVELTTIPPYLCALYSIRDGTNREAAAVLRSVVMEEMLHMALVANLLNAVGGTPRLRGAKGFPTYPANLFIEGGLEVPLRRFSKESVETFMEIEQPEPPAARANAAEPSAPRTIGEFYAQVRKELVALCKKFGEKKVFTGRRAQITTEYYYGGAGCVFEIEDLADADQAIAEIVDQGEGAPRDVFRPDHEVRGKGGLPGFLREFSEQAVGASVNEGRLPFFMSGISKRATGAPVAKKGEKFRQTLFSGHEEPAHYYRFQEIHAGRYYQAKDTMRSGPTGPQFPVQWEAVHRMRLNPTLATTPPSSRAEQREFGRCYARLLERLEVGFAGEPRVLTHIAGDMYELRQRAVELMRVPFDDETTVGPSFELPRDG